MRSSCGNLRQWPSHTGKFHKTLVDMYIINNLINNNMAFNLNKSDDLIKLVIKKSSTTSKFDLSIKRESYSVSENYHVDQKKLVYLWYWGTIYLVEVAWYSYQNSSNSDVINDKLLVRQLNCWYRYIIKMRQIIVFRMLN
jgi:hypothetical protein